MNSPRTIRYRLGPQGRYTLDIGARALYADGQLVPLGSRAFELLAAIVEAGGGAVGKDELMRRAWAGLVVEEANLHVQVSALRKLLGADAIATVQSLGYRWAWPAAPADATASRDNLPADRTSFFGRTALLQDAHAALGRCRLLSLIGIGGTGKTRLALVLGRQLLEQLADGVWWVDLAPLDRSDQVPAAVARTLGVTLQDEGDAAEQLGRALRARQLVLILDNCEHLLAEVARLAHAWLNAVPGLKVIATSREALATEGEWVLPVGPLGLPGPTASDDEIAASESVQLLVDRAVRVAPSMGLAPADALTLAEICRRVDGIPLAIEIAAAQLRTVSPSQLLTLLQERFRLLANLAHSLPRQRMMQTVIEWSFDHLQGQEQELLLGLALCSGGCELDTARALMGPETPAAALTAALGRLAEQALMTVQPGAGHPRYVLLETVSQFALDRMGAQSLAATLRARFVAHFLAMAEAHDDEILRQGRGAATLDRIDRERGNLLRALQFCTLSGDASAVTHGLQLAGALRHYWVARSQIRTGLEVTQSALQRAGPAYAPDRALLLALVSEAQLLGELGRTEEAVQAMGRVVAVARATGDRAHEASALGFRAALLDLLKRFDEAAADHEAARRVAEALGDERLVADVLSRQANHASSRGRYDEAAALLEQALPLRRRLAHGYRLAVTLINSGAVSTRRGRWCEARAYLGEAALLLEAVGSDALDAALVHHAAALLHRAECWAELATVRAAERQHRESAVLPDDPEDKALAQAQIGDARAALGREAFEVACERGRRLDIAHARKLLADWLQRHPDDSTHEP
jgi:non-specific serine/threonine protein kinase